MLYFVVQLYTDRVICQFDKYEDLVECLVYHFDNEHRSKVGVYIGRWVDSWEGPFLVPSVEHLKRSLCREYSI